MGFDIKAALDQIVAFVSQNYLLVFAGLVLLVLFSSKGIFARVRQGIEKALIENWQLTLLASTGIALSLASGYTTFDGLRNFTSAPLLSVLISFGVQGVMLSTAVIVTCEEIVPEHYLRLDPDQNALPPFLVDAVVPVPYGADPTACPYFYDYDPAHLNHYKAVARDDDQWAAWLEEWVYGIESWDHYLDKVGGAQLARIRANTVAGYAPGLDRR